MLCKKMMARLWHNYGTIKREAIDYLKLKSKITTKEYIGLVNVSLRTAKRDLLSLKGKRIIKFIGSPKTGYYCLNGTVRGDKK